MIETRRLKNVVVFIQTIFSFVLSRKIIKIFTSLNNFIKLKKLKDQGIFKNLAFNS